MSANLLQRLTPNNNVQRHIFRAVLYFALVICVGMFASQLNEQAKRNDTNQNYKTLLQAGDVRPLEKVQITYFVCPKRIEFDDAFDLNMDKCERDKTAKPIVQPQYLANINEVPKITDSSGQSVKANWALVRHELSEEDYEWIGNKGFFTVLALPRYAHVLTYVILPRKKVLLQSGYASDTTFTFNSSELMNTKYIELLVNFGELKIFGPTDIAAHFVKRAQVANFFGLLHSQREASSLARQLELGLPVVLAAIAIILDHSSVMSYLSLYAASRAVHDYIGFQMEVRRFQDGSLSEYLYFISVGTGFAFLVLFTATIVGLNVRRIKLAHRWLFVAVMGGLFGLGKFIDPSFSTTSDLWGDSLAILTSFAVMLYAGYDRFKNPPTAETKASNPETYSRVSVALVATRLGIVTIAFAVHGWVNIRDLIGHSANSELKSRLDWKTMLLMPSLMTASLLEVGSTAKKMLNFGRDMATKALIEQELNVGREVQARMLPRLRTTTDSWHWRAMYLPAEALAGDWFDIRELTFADGRTLLVACVADVTGHGVGSSLATSVICSHWGLWCTRLQASGFPESPEVKQQELRRAPYGIHLGLKALRENENCTAIFAIFDPVRNEVTFCSAGHPGILVIGHKSFRYFTTQGERLGGEIFEDTVWVAKTEVLKGDELVALYSDGVVPLRATVSSWAAQIKRKANAGTIDKAEVLLVRQLRENKHGFVDAPELKDDMTLVMVRRNLQQSSVLPENGSKPEAENSPSVGQDPAQLPQTA